MGDVSSGRPTGINIFAIVKPDRTNVHDCDCDSTNWIIYSLLLSSHASKLWK